MKKLSTLFLLCATTLSLAQDVKSCLFIGLYDEEKKGVCSDRAMVQENVKDYAEYNQRRTQFNEEHKGETPSTKFIAESESVIAYEYEKAVGGWNCSVKVIGITTGASLDDCNKRLADQQIKYPKDFKTKPDVILTRQGSPSIRKQTLTEDFGGLTGTFILADKTNGGKLLVAQLANKTQDKLATILLRSDDGKMMVEYIYPGETMTRKYDSKNLDIQIIYQDSKKPKRDFSLVGFVKDEVRKQITNLNGNLKVRKWDPACMCVRG